MPAAENIARFRKLVSERGFAAAFRFATRYALLQIVAAFSNFRMGVLNALLRSDAFVEFRYKRLARRFNRLAFLRRVGTFDNTRFLGKHILKFPTDLWVYQEMIHELRPDVIVESGVFLGGSTFYLARLCQLAGNGRVIGIDTTLDHVDPDTKALPNVTLIEGSSVDPAVYERVRAQIRHGETVMVILDSDHEAPHVLQEMRLYAQIVTPGQYMVVEDGIVDHVYPVLYDRGPGHAITQFLASDASFAVDYSRNKYMLTVSPGGYLRKSAPAPDLNNEADLYRPLLLWLPGSKIPAEPPWRRLLGQGRKE